jgi:hypothetical protein
MVMFNSFILMFALQHFILLNFLPGDKLEKPLMFHKNQGANVRITERGKYKNLKY